MGGARVTGQSEPWLASSAVCTLPVWSSSYIDLHVQLLDIGCYLFGCYILVCVLACVWAIIYSIYKKTTISTAF